LSWIDKDVELLRYIAQKRTFGKYNKYIGVIIVVYTQKLIETDMYHTKEAISFECNDTIQV